MPEDLLDILDETHTAIRHMAKQLSDEEYRRQYHEDLSPLGWHIGHCAFIESYWLREVILGDNSLTKQLEWLYVPENIIKPKRGPALPPLHEHLAWCEQISNENALIFKRAEPRFKAHPLNENNYLLRFIIQHHSQHLETMAMVLAQRQLKTKPAIVIHQPLLANDIHYTFTTYDAGNHLIGNLDQTEAFDNEVPTHYVDVASFSLADTPVSNADWLTFMNDQGYDNKQYWSQAGWKWREENNITQPETWLQDEFDSFYEVSATGANALKSDAAVSGINYFEANAFIDWLKSQTDRYSEIRLPHEYEWEVADSSGLLPNTNEVWEWCENSFHPYPDFQAFPYDNYSQPWFDGSHFSLRGGSQYTQTSIRRSSFRNFYTPDKRHIFSGLRLAFARN